MPNKRATVDAYVFNPQQELASLHQFMGRWQDLRDFHERMGSGIKVPKTIDETLLEVGRPFTARSLLDDKDVRPESRECYWNAWQLFLRQPGLHYCEGMVVLEGFGMPVLHGWCIDEEDRVWDPSVSQHRGAVYHGAQFEDDFVHKAWEQLRETELIGIFANAGCGGPDADKVLEGIVGAAKRSAIAANI